MAKDVSSNSRRTASASDKTPVSNDALWVRRNAVTGRFVQSKKSGGAFKGARRAG